MNPSPKEPQLEQLMEHSDWVRRLARSLVSDDNQAEDIVQQTWLEVMRRPPSRAENLKAWLGLVVRNAARKMGREKKRRLARERKVSKGEVLPPEPPAHDRERLQKTITESVLTLDEPYRTVVLLRFFEEMSPNEIAAHLKIPLNTVYTQLRRGMDTLRARLDSKYGNREAWIVVALPWAALRKTGTTKVTKFRSYGAAAAVLVGLCTLTTALLVGGVSPQPARSAAIVSPTQESSDPIVPRTAIVDAVKPAGIELSPKVEQESVHPAEPPSEEPSSAPATLEEPVAEPKGQGQKSIQRVLVGQQPRDDGKSGVFGINKPPGKVTIKIKNNPDAPKLSKP